MSWKPYVKVGKEWATNALVFETEAEAKGSADDTMRRWISVSETKAVEGTEPVTHRWEEGGRLFDVRKPDDPGHVPPDRVQL